MHSRQASTVNSSGWFIILLFLFITGAWRYWPLVLGLFIAYKLVWPLVAREVNAAVHGNIVYQNNAYQDRGKRKRMPSELSYEKPKRRSSEPRYALGDDGELVPVEEPLEDYEARYHKRDGFV